MAVLTVKKSREQVVNSTDLQVHVGSEVG